MADTVTKPETTRILNKGRGQRISVLTFSGEHFVNNRWTINGTHGVGTLVRSQNQEFSNGRLPARDEDDTSTNGHFTVTSDT